MTEFQNKSFSVYPGGTGGQEYRDNWDRVFGKKEKESRVGVMVSALQDTVHQDVANTRPAKSVKVMDGQHEERCPWCSRTLPSFGRCECREQVASAPGLHKEKEPEPTVEPEPLLCEWCGADYFECICTIRI